MSYAASPASTEPPSKRPSRTVLTLTLIPIVAVIIIANIGAKTSFVTLGDHPLLTLAANPTKAVMVLTSPQLSAFEYYTTVFIRSLFVDPFWFMIGVWYGNSSIRWMKRRLPSMGILLQQIEDWFPRFGPVLVALYSSQPLVILLAGASTMRMRTFLAIDFLGTAVVAIGVRQLGWVAEKQVGAVTDFLERYRWWFIGLSALLLVQFAWELWTTRNTNSVTAMGDSLEEEARKDQP